MSNFLWENSRFVPETQHGDDIIKGSRSSLSRERPKWSDGVIRHVATLPWATAGCATQACGPVTLFKILCSKYKYYYPTLQMRKLRFLEISDLGDSLEEQERLYVLMPDRPGFRSRLAMNYQRGLFFFFSKASLNFCFLFWKTQDNDNQFVAVVVVQSLSRVWLFVTSWTVSHQASLSFTIFRSLLKLMSTEFVMPPNHLVLCRPLLLLPSIFPSIRVFSNESALRIRWPK